MLCGLSAGLTLADMRSMRVTDVANIVMESASMRADADKDEVVDATQADIDNLKCL